MTKRSNNGFYEYPIERQRIRWQHVAGDQWHAQVFGTATINGESREFKFPSAGLYVIVGADAARKLAEGTAKSKVVRSLFGVENDSKR